MFVVSPTSKFSVHYIRTGYGWIAKQGRITAVVPTRQFILSLAVFLITFIISKVNTKFGPSFQVSNELAIQFYSVVAQALAGLLAILIAYLVFVMQGADQQLTSSYRALKNDLGKLSVLITDYPQVLSRICNSLHEVIDTYTLLALEQLSSASEDRPDWQAVLTGFEEQYQSLKPQLRRRERGHLQRILLSLKEIEDSLNTIGIQTIGIIVTENFVTAVASFSLLLGTSLTLLLLFGAIDIGTQYPSLANATTLAFLCWTLLVVLQLVRHSRDMYRELESHVALPVVDDVVDDKE